MTSTAPSPTRVSRLGLALAVLLASAFTLASGGTALAARERGAVSKAVTFAVRNTNGSALPCASDGAAYEIKGHLVAPRTTRGKAARSRRGVTLYLHGLGFGEWFWNFGSGRYNYAVAQAKAGHTSVVIDRLGYDSSGRPDGNRVCLGAHADMAHQIIGELRSGEYSVASGRAVRFRKVALAGHSAGGAIASVEAYSFKDIDALIVMSFSFQNQPRAQVAFGPTRDTCLAGGEPAEPGAPSGYAYFGRPDLGDFQSIMFHRATASVLEAATPLRNRDPCGDTASIIAAILQQKASVRKIRVPVLVVCGTRDALYAPLGCSMQEERYTGSRNSSLALVPSAGHALTLERSAPRFRRKLSRWLSKRGF